MKFINKLVVATMVVATLFASQVQSQDFNDNSSQAYEDSNYMSAALPVGVLVVAGVIIATTNRHHHHSGHGSCSHSHSHYHASSGGCGCR